MSKAAQLMVKCLENEGVTVVFGLPGEENIRFVQALASSDIRYVLTRHEQAASFMAEMYGRVTGRPAVVSATLGPGAINLQLGVADATTNSTPMVAISAQVGQDRQFKESHQYVDLVSMFAPITRWAAGIPTVLAIPEMFRKSFKVAESERPAAVYLAVPENIDTDAADYPDLTPLPRNVVRAEAPAARQVARAVDILRKAKRPVVLAGHGAARGDATAALVRFSEEFGILVANTFPGKGVMPDDHSNGIGTLGFMRHDYVNFGFDSADVIIAVGYELQDSTPSGLTRRPTRGSSTFIASQPRSTCTIRLTSGSSATSVPRSTRSRTHSPGTPSTPIRACPGPACLPRSSLGDNRIRDIR